MEHLHLVENCLAIRKYFLLKQTKYKYDVLSLFIQTVAVPLNKTMRSMNARNKIISKIQRWSPQRKLRFDDTANQIRKDKKYMPPRTYSNIIINKYLISRPVIKNFVVKLLHFMFIFVQILADCNIILLICTELFS